MAHFAELKTKSDPTGFTSDTHQVVERVVVVGNDCVPSDMHVDGETWCINFFKGGTWKQTSYNNNFRKQYAGIGFTYDAAKNKFIGSQPHASWALDANDDWQAPVTYPTVTDNGQEPTAKMREAERREAADDYWRYHISWNETKYNANNTTGWEATKSNDETEIPTVYDWNGTAWLSS